MGVDEQIKSIKPTMAETQALQSDQKGEHQLFTYLLPLTFAKPPFDEAFSFKAFSCAASSLLFLYIKINIQRSIICSDMQSQSKKSEC